MASLGQINSEVEANASTGGSGSVTIVPPDVYEVEIHDSDVKPSQSGKGMNLDYKVTIVSGPHKGVWWFDGITSIQHESAQAQTIAQGQLRALAEACGLDWPLTNGDSEVFHHRPFHAQVDIETYQSKKHNKEMQKNKVVKFLYGDLQPDERPAPRPPETKSAATSAPATQAGGAPARSWQRKT